MRKALLKVNEIKLGIKKVICRHMYPFHVLIVVIVASALREEIFANFFFGHFAGINFCELGLTNDFPAIHFCEGNLYKYFNFEFLIKN